MTKMQLNCKFVKDSAGIESLLKSGGVRAICDQYGTKVKDFAEGLSDSGKAKYRVIDYNDSNRAVTLVGTTDIISRESNAKHGNALLRGLKNL